MELILFFQLVKMHIKNHIHIRIITLYYFKKRLECSIVIFDFYELFFPQWQRFDIRETKQEHKVEQ